MFCIYTAKKSLVIGDAFFFFSFFLNLFCQPVKYVIGDNWTSFLSKRKYIEMLMSRSEVRARRPGTRDFVFAQE